MTLYYEDVPADDSDVPQLPPLLTAVAVPSGQNVHHKAIALAASSEVGTIFYSEAVDRMHTVSYTHLTLPTICSV